MSTNNKNLHAGHRERVKREFLANGFVNKMPQHKMLELLLFYCIPRIDTNEIAHEMLECYGNIAGVLDAPVDELIKFKGITENNVGLLKLIMPIAREYLSDKEDFSKNFNCYNDICSFLLNKYAGRNIETLSILCLDGSGKMLSFDILSEGDLTSVGISTREIIQIALRTNASVVIMAHNHPGGIALPSGEDKAITEMVHGALMHIGVKLCDHIIIATGDYVSLMQSKDYNYIFK